MPKTKDFLINFSLLVLGTSFLLILLELVVFRFILLAPDQPQVAFVNAVIKYKPHQKGINRQRSEAKAEFRINANGWNSRHERYQLERSQKHRIAVVGDSYVHADLVDFDQSLAESLEARFGSAHCEVYRFGINGAPLSQYLHMIRNEVVVYDPDVIVVVIVHNDFSESYKYKPGVYTSSFLKLNIENEVVTGEYEPKRYERKWWSPIRERSAIWRYFAYRQGVRFGPLRDLILGKRREVYQANIPLRSVDANRRNNELVADYVFSRIHEITRKRGIELLLVMEGDRRSIYAGIDGPDLYEKGVLSLNRTAKTAADTQDIHFIDLHPVFEQDYAAYGRELNLKSDWHWNTYAHEIVANTIYDYLAAHRLLTKPCRPASPEAGCGGSTDAQLAQAIAEAARSPQQRFPTRWL